MTMRLIPKNWAQFQHYKDRSPPWIRLHHNLLDNREFQKLPLQSRALAPMLWLLASESIDGCFDGSIEEIAFRLRRSENEIEEGLEPLLKSGFFLPFDGMQLLEKEKELTPSQFRAKQNGFGSRHISDLIKREVWVRDGGKCCNCQSTENLEYDHKLPVSKGGDSSFENIQLLCRTCNRKKRTKTAEQFATPAQPWLELRTTETETKTETYTEREAKKRSAKPLAVACPPNVNDSTWNDWLTLRKAKKAPVTQTVVDHAEREAQKAGMTLDAFLRVWCARGSQGLEASWLKPDERQRYGASPNARIDSGMEAVQRAKLMLFGGGDEI